MARIEQFESIEAWKKARELAGEIYKITSEGALARDWGLKDQLQRSAVSVMSNIAEGFERSSDNEFQHFLSIAKGSAGEVVSHLYVALDVGYIDEQTFERLRGHARETGRLVGGFRTYLRRTKG